MNQKSDLRDQGAWLAEIASKTTPEANSAAFQHTVQSNSWCLVCSKFCNYSRYFSTGKQHEDKLRPYCRLISTKSRNRKRRCSYPKDTYRNKKQIIPKSRIPESRSSYWRDWRDNADEISKCKRKRVVKTADITRSKTFSVEMAVQLNMCEVQQIQNLTTVFPFLQAYLGAIFTISWGIKMSVTESSCDYPKESQPSWEQRIWEHSGLWGSLPESLSLMLQAVKKRRWIWNRWRCWRW